ncbi:MAG: hypothetical protein KAH84_03865 [Thiomargarita sp.]|nr:hypothetical protein [Thiomargarita sp.]
MQKNIKDSTMAYAFLLASSPVWAVNGKTGNISNSSGDESDNIPINPSKPLKIPDIPGKTQTQTQTQKFRISSIELNVKDKNQIMECQSLRKKVEPRPRRIVSLAFDQRKRQTVTLQFNMSSIPSQKEEQVLVLLYSRCLTTKPGLNTPLSKNKLKLDTKDIDIMGSYVVPVVIAKPTNNYRVSPAATKMILEVDMETYKLNRQLKSGNNTFYFQAALLKKTDFDKKNYAVMTLSPLEAIHVTANNTCPTKKQKNDAMNTENIACEIIPGKTK